MDFDLSDLFGGALGFNILGGLGGKMFDKLPELPVGGSPPAPTMLKAGGEDMAPQGLLAPGAGLLKAGLETGPIAAGGAPRGGGLLGGDNPADVQAPGSIVAQARLPGGGFRPPGAPSPVPVQPAPALATPAGSGRLPDPDRTRTFPSVTTPVIPNSRGGPDERTAPETRPIVPPKIDTTERTSSGNPIYTGAPTTPETTGSPAAKPAESGKPSEEPNQTTLQKFLGEMGNIKPGPQQQLHPANMSYGAPHIPQGGADLFSKILASHADLIKKVGVPEIPKTRRY